MTREYFKDTFQLSHNPASPIHLQLSDYFIHQIKSGALKSGDMIIGENDIVDLLGISRTTVRYALNRLVEDGYIVRYRGKGSYVAEPILRRNINYLYNFSDNIRDSGSAPSSAIIRCEIIKADEMTFNKMKLASVGQKVFLLERLRMADGIPLILENTFIPYYLCEGIENNDFSHRSLYNILENHYNIKISHATETIGAVNIKKKDAEILKCKNGMAGYRIERISYLASGHICELTQSVTRGDRCVFHLDLHNNKSTHNSVNFRRQLSINNENK